MFYWDLMRNSLRNSLRNFRRNLLRNLCRNLLRNLRRNLLRNLLGVSSPPSKARLINSEAKPPAERSGANKVSIYLYMFSTRHLQCPSGVQRTKPYDEREARV